MEDMKRILGKRNCPCECGEVGLRRADTELFRCGWHAVGTEEREAVDTAEAVRQASFLITHCLPRASAMSWLLNLLLVLANAEVPS